MPYTSNDFGVCFPLFTHRNSETGKNRRTSRHARTQASIQSVGFEFAANWVFSKTNCKRKRLTNELLLLFNKNLFPYFCVNLSILRYFERLFFGFPWTLLNGEWTHIYNSLKRHDKSKANDLTMDIVDDLKWSFHIKTRRASFSHENVPSFRAKLNKTKQKDGIISQQSGHHTYQ